MTTLTTEQLKKVTHADLRAIFSGASVTSIAYCIGEEWTQNDKERLIKKLQDQLKRGA